MTESDFKQHYLRQRAPAEGRFALEALALCPLLAASTSLPIALGLSGVMLLALLVSTLILSLTATRANGMLRVALVFVASATVVAGSELALQAFAFALYQQLSLLLPLVVASSVLLLINPTHAQGANPTSFPRSFRIGVMLALAMTAFGTVRELAGSPTLLAPVGFLLLGLLLAALKRSHLIGHDAPLDPLVIKPGSRRVRVTGKIQGPDN